ncbi:UNVERIFIED_CONTAM: hypothetical protein FKN15_047243 [Acipenser sinensis]
MLFSEACAVSHPLLYTLQTHHAATQSYSVGGQRSPRQLTGKPIGARPDHRGRWCTVSRGHPGRPSPPSPGQRSANCKVLNSDLRHYLSLQFQKGSLDHKLQQVIRDNLYLRTIPWGAITGIAGVWGAVPRPTLSISAVYLSSLCLSSVSRLCSSACSSVVSAVMSIVPFLTPLVAMCHINQKTQFENPVLEAKKKLTQEGLDKPQQAAAPPTDAERPPFTRDPSQLQGTMVRTALRKSNLGFGFTIIGGDRSDEFLQVKNVLKDGPAAQDTKIASGDVIVDINGTCVLGKTHADVVQMFQSITVNQYVDMVLCRGYPLPEDTGSEPSSDIVTATPLINGQPMLTKGEPMHGSQELQFIPSDQNGRPVIKALPNGRFNGPLAEHPENRSSMASTGLLQPELVTVPLVKGPNGFGFAIADSPLGQKVKMILDGQWCSGLLKGDVLKEISRQNVQTLTHSQVVDILKEFPVGSEVSVLVLRGAPNTRDLDVFIKRKQDSGFGFRVLGGEGPEQPVYIGAIVPLGAAEKDGRLRAGDELLCIDGVQVKGKSHKQVLELMTNAARSGHVLLTVRRQVFYTDKTSDEERNVTPDPLLNGSPKMPHIEVPSRLQGEPYEVVLQKKESEGFGFVILTSKNKPPPGVIPHKIGRVIEGSPTDRCGKLKVGDRISAVNGQSIVDLSHNDIVQLIKEAGNAVTLAVVPEDEHSGPPSGSSSAKQSPAPQHRAMGQTQTNQRMLEDRYESRWCQTEQAIIVIHMDPMNVSPASFPKEVTSSEEPPPFSPSFNSTSTPESTPTARQEDASVGQLNKPVSGETSPTSTDKKGQNITKNKLAIKTNEKRERSASPRNPDARNELQVKKKESNVSRSGRSASPRKANRERSDMNKERSPSPRKTEKNTAELKDRSVSPKKGERKDYSEATKERKSRTKEQPNVARTRSSSPRKAHKEEHAEENKEMLNSGDDRQRITSSGKADKHGHSKESSDRWEHPTRREDGLKNKTASNTEEKPPVGKRKNHEEKVASPTKAQEQRREASEELEKDGKPQRSRSPDRRRKERPAREKANKETQEPTTLSQKQLGIRDGEVKRQDWEHKKDMGHAGGSENNATSGGRKAPITPGPWKVPSSVKVGVEKQEKHT